MTRTKLIYFLSSFVLVIGCFALKQSYSMFIDTKESEPITAVVPMLDVTLSMPSVTVEPGKEILIKQTVTNNSNIPINFGITTDKPDNVSVVKDDSMPNLPYGIKSEEDTSLAAKSSREISFVISNTEGLSNLTVNFTLNKNYTTITTTTSNLSNITNFKKVYTITYSGIINNEYSTIISEGSSLNITFINDIPNRINIYENGIELDRSTYPYQNGKLILTDVKGDLVIEKGESTLVDGKTFSKTVKDLVNNTTDATYKSVDTSITYIGFYEEELPTGHTKETLESLPNVSVSNDNKIKAYNDSGKVYVYSKNDIFTDASMYSMFRNMQSLTTLDLLVLDTSKTTEMKSTFKDVHKLLTLDLSNFNTNRVTTFEEFFANCYSLKSVVLSELETSNATVFISFFYNCNSLENLDLSNFNTSKAKLMDYMFYGCSSLTSLDISRFDTSNVTGMYGMFQGCNNLTSLDLGSFNTFNVKTLGCMFYGCSSLTSLDLSSFDTSSVTDMNSMFAYCSNLKTIYVSDLWNTDAVTASKAMFTNTYSLVGGNGTKYNSSIVDKTYARIDTTDTPGYFTYKAN